jgi:hypothetical protein
MPRRIIKSGMAYFYTVGDRALSQSDARHAAMAKSSVIDSLSGTDTEIGLSLFGQARAIAAERRIGRIEGAAPPTGGSTSDSSA